MRNTEERLGGIWILARDAQTTDARLEMTTNKMRTRVIDHAIVYQHGPQYYVSSERLTAQWSMPRREMNDGMIRLSIETCAMYTAAD